MKIITTKVDEVVRIRISSFTRVPGEGDGHLVRDAEEKHISLTETTIDEVFEVVEAAILNHIYSQNVRQVK